AGVEVGGAMTGEADVPELGVHVLGAQREPLAGPPDLGRPVPVVRAQGIGSPGGHDVHVRTTHAEQLGDRLCRVVEQVGVVDEYELGGEVVGHVGEGVVDIGRVDDDA